MWRLQTYAGLSFISILAMIYYAFHSRGQFYPAMVYLSISKISLVLVLNMGLVVMCILWQLTKKIFLGSLREAEVERLNEQSWKEVIEVLFAITIFKQDFSVSFLAMVTALLLIKGLHWLVQTRLEYVETIQTVTVISHIRIASFMGFLLLIDGLFLYNCLQILLETQQASVALFFLFEYMILATTTMSTSIKYIFCVSDMLMEGQWERKSMYTFCLDLVHDLLHLSLYMCFFMLTFINYGVPLHLIRQLYETFHSFKLRVADYIRYRKITSNLNERYPDATPEELSTSDVTCIICREEMTAAKKLICGHLFHVHCLRLWMERQHTCPTCRALVWPYESASTTTDRSSGSQAVVCQRASTSISEGLTDGSDSVDDNTSNEQARILNAAAASAASIYGKSLVYPSPATLIWNPGFAVIVPVNGPLLDANSTNYVDGQRSLGALQFQQLGFIGGHLLSPPALSTRCFLVPVQLPTTSMMFTESNNFSMMSTHLDTRIKFVEHQIEVLQNQLQCLQISREDGLANTPDPVPSDKKGKAIAYSSITDSGNL